MPETRNSKLLESFVAYCKANPDQRFWQALVNWASVGYILTSRHNVAYLPHGGFMDEVKDTFYWEGKNA